MSLKRNYSAAIGGQGYDDQMLPMKVPNTSISWPRYNQNDYSVSSDNRGMSSYGSGGMDTGMSYTLSTNRMYQTGMGGSRMPRITDRLKSMSEMSTSSNSMYGHSSSNSMFGHSYSDYDMGAAGYGGSVSDFRYNQGYNQNALDDLYDLDVGSGFAYGGLPGVGDLSSWDYNTLLNDYFNTPAGSFGQEYSRGQGRRGQGMRGQGRGQGGQQKRGRGSGYSHSGGQSFNTGRGIQKQGRGSGRGGSMGQGGQGSGVQRGKGQVKGGKARGMGLTGAGPMVGDRGGRKRTTSTQVKSVSDKIMNMVTDTKGKGAKVSPKCVISKPASLMDLVDTASQRKMNKMATYTEEGKRLAQFIEFFRSSPDRVNGIQTIGNALTASRLKLHIQFESEDLMFVTKPLFTGVLKIGGFFFTRGLGLSKKAVKHDCFERAVKMLHTMSVDEIMALEDCGKEALRAEVKHQSQVDFEAFRMFLSQKQAAEIETSDKIRTAAVSESQVAERNFPLADKMMMLKKEVLKSDSQKEGFVLVSCFDVLCFKVGIGVAALFKVVDLAHTRQYNTQPYKGDVDIELVCEIYYDGVQVGRGQGKPRKKAQTAAYRNIRHRLLHEPISDIAQGKKLPSDPISLPDYFEIVYKGAKPQEGNNHQRLFSLKVYPPDISRSVDELVIIETQGDDMEENAYKILEYSASKNGMLLEWKQLDKSSTVNGFRCELSLNGQKTVVGIGQSKHKARNMAAAMLLAEFYLSQDVIKMRFTTNLTNAVPYSAILARAQELKEEGPPRPDRIAWADTPPDTTTEQGSSEGNSSDSVKPFLDDPLRLWIEDAVVEYLENYSKRVTLEELFFGPGYSTSLRKFSYAASHHCLLLPSVRSFNKEGYLMFHHRGITPQEMVKVLHLNKAQKGTSGRYSLVRANKPFSAVQQAQFARSFPDTWVVRARKLLEAEKLKKEEEAAALKAAKSQATTATTQDSLGESAAEADYTAEEEAGFEETEREEGITATVEEELSEDMAGEGGLAIDKDPATTT